MRDSHLSVLFIEVLKSEPRRRPGLGRTAKILFQKPLTQFNAFLREEFRARNIYSQVK